MRVLGKVSVSVWRLADDPVYGDHAGYFILTDPTGEKEIEPDQRWIFATAELATDWARSSGWEVVPLIGT